MIRPVLCIVALLMVCHAALGDDPSRAEESAYTFTLNGKPFEPYVISLGGDPDHPRPGDVICIDYPLFLTLGPERECHFVTTPKEDGRLLLRAADGSRRVVGAGVRWTFKDGKKVIFNPFAELTADEIKGLWGVALDAWPEGMEENLKQIDMTRTCVTITGRLLPRHYTGGKMPALPGGIRYLNVAEPFNRGISDYGVLERLTELRFLMVYGMTDESIDARLLAGSQSLRCLILRTQALKHPETLSRLSGIEHLNLANTPGLDTVEFVSQMPRLRRLDVQGTQVRDLSPLRGLSKLEEVTASTSPVEKLPEGSLPALRKLTVFSTGLTEPAVKAFAQRNPQCEVFFRWDEALRKATAKATRLRIRSGGACHRQPAKEKTLFELKDAGRIRDFVRQIGIVEAESGFECMCCGEPTFEFYQDDKLIAMVGFHHGRSLRWPGHWPADAMLTAESQVNLPKWLADHGFDALQKAREAELAAQEKERQKRQRLLECYPEGARKLFNVRLSPLGDAEARQGKRIAEAVGDPVELALATCRALGVVAGPWSPTDNDQRLIIAAGRTVKGNDFLAALKRLRGEQAAELGAARMFFREGYDVKLDPESRVEWTVRLASTVLDHGWNANKPSVMCRLASLKDAKVTALLHRVAKGDVGHDERGYGEEPRLRPSAYLALAEQGDDSIKPGVEKLLAKTPEGPDRAALEVSLALLGNPKYIKREHFQYQSYTIGFAAIQAIENFAGREGMDVLVEAGVEHPWHAVDEEAILAVQRITGQTWCKDPEHERVTNYRKQMEKWWREKGVEFVKKRRAKAPDGAPSGGP